MSTKAHSTLTGSDLHEPKGVATATAGQVYLSDGAGSGSWVDTGSTISTASLTTGDLKPTFKITADTGWVMCDDGTIGDISSGASTLASATTQALFYLLWANFTNSVAAVSGGRGISAAADYAAHKTIALPKMLGRVFGVAGAGAGLTSYTMGQLTGENLHTLTSSEVPSHTHTGTTGGQSADHSHATTIPNTFPGSVFNGGGGGWVTTGTNNQTSSGVSNDHTHSFTTSSAGSDGAHNIMQPTVFLKMMVKL